MTTKLRICAEKYLPSEKQIVNQMYQKTKRAGRLRAAFITQKQWPDNAKITIGFFSDSNNPNLEYTPLSILNRDGKMDPIEKQIRDLRPYEAVMKVVNERIKPIVGLGLEFVDNVYDATIRISFEDDGAWSYVGTDILEQPTNQATMNFGWIDAATIMHEFGHALGMIHEHQNPRGKTIPWDKQAVYNWASKTQGWDKQTTDVNILNHYALNITNGSNFDKESIMLYFFPKQLTTDNKGTAQNVRLSATDVYWLNKHYPNSKMTPEEFYENAYNLNINDSVVTGGVFRSGGGDGLSRLQIVGIFVLFIVSVIAAIAYSKSRQSGKPFFTELKNIFSFKKGDTSNFISGEPGFNNFLSLIN